MKLYIFTLLLLSVLPTLAQQQDTAQDREARRAERAAYWGRFFSVGYEGGTIAPFGIRGELGGTERNSFV